MASPAATSRLKSVFSVASKGALNRQIASSLAQPFSKCYAETRSHIYSKPSLTWSFSKHLPPPSHITHHFSAMDPLSTIKETEMEQLKRRGAQSPSPLKLLCLGGPGVGKGTYASLVSMRLRIPHISTGELIRKELSKLPTSCSTTGELILLEAVRTAMNQGRLIGDEVILKLLSNRLRQMDPNVGFILDGFPRTINQARILDDTVGGVDMAINFHLDDNILVAKCLGRRICSQCGKDYNLSHVDFWTHALTAKGLIKRKRFFLPARLPPAECASKLTMRGDDSNEAAVRERLRLFARESEPLEQHYRSQGKLVDLDVGAGAESVWPRLLDAIGDVEHNSDYMAAYCQ